MKLQLWQKHYKIDTRNNNFSAEYGASALARDEAEK